MQKIALLTNLAHTLEALRCHCIDSQVAKLLNLGLNNNVLNVLACEETSKFVKLNPPQDSKIINKMIGLQTLNAECNKAQQMQHKAV